MFDFGVSHNEPEYERPTWWHRSVYRNLDNSGLPTSRKLMATCPFVGTNVLCHSVLEVDPRVVRGAQCCYLSQPTRWGCWTATSFLPARRLLVSVFAKETCRGAGKEDHERKP